MSLINDCKLNSTNQISIENDENIDIIDITSNEDESSSNTLNSSLIKQIDQISKNCLTGEINIEIPLLATKHIRLRKHCPNVKIVKKIKVINNESNLDNNFHLNDRNDIIIEPTKQYTDDIAIETNRENENEPSDNSELTKETIEKKNFKKRKSSNFLENNNQDIIGSFQDSDCNLFKENWNIELNEYPLNSAHYFMKENFPNMYNDIKNYYRFVKLNEQRKLKKNLSVEIKNVFNKELFLLNQVKYNENVNSTPKLLWRKRYNNIDLESKFYLKL